MADIWGKRGAGTTLTLTVTATLTLSLGLEVGGKTLP